MIDNQRGVILPLLAAFLSGLLALTAVGVGFGRMTFAASEAQSAADVAAITGAFAVFKNTSPTLDALVALNGNRVGNESAISMLADLTVGTYDYDTRSFNAGGALLNAVRARISTNVTNPFGALIQKGNQPVSKIAYAALSGLSGGRPTLPIVIGECNFEDNCFSQSCMPRLTQVPSPDDNSGWTAFFLNSNQQTVESYVPLPCGGGNIENIWVGDHINVSNGQTTPLLRAFDCLIDHGMLEHIIPIVPCGGQFNQTKEVVGFATIRLDEVTTQGGDKGIELQAIFKSNAVGALGGSMFGTGNIALVPVN